MIKISDIIINPNDAEPIIPNEDLVPAGHYHSVIKEVYDYESSKKGDAVVLVYKLSNRSEDYLIKMYYYIHSPFLDELKRTLGSYVSKPTGIEKFVGYEEELDLVYSDTGFGSLQNRKLISPATSGHAARSSKIAQILEEDDDDEEEAGDAE